MAVTVQRLIEAQLAEDGIAANAVLLEAKLVDNGLEGSQTYDASMAVAVTKVRLAFLNQLLTRADITEGDMSIKLDRGAIEKAIARIEQEAGLVKGPTVRILSDRW